jgi:hypothetical protein
MPYTALASSILNVSGSDGTGKAGKAAGILGSVGGLLSGPTDAITGIIGGIFEKQRLDSLARQARDRAEYNSKLLDLAAEDVMSSYDRQAMDYMLGVGKSIGAQRAGYAAQNVRVGSGVQSRVEAESRSQARINLANARNIASAQARGIRAQSALSRMTGRHAYQELRAQGSAQLQGAIAGGLAAVVAGPIKELGTNAGALSAFKPSGQVPSEQDPYQVAMGGADAYHSANAGSFGKTGFERRND